jgi:parvulin-like peptidyl-prolyl isomerase
MPNNQPPRELTKKHIARQERERNQTRILRYAAIIIVALVVLVLAYGILDQTYLKNQRPVAKVGDKTITLTDFQKEVRYKRWDLVRSYQQAAQLAQAFASSPELAQSFQNNLDQISQQLDPTYASVLGSQAVEELIQFAVIEREAKNQGITVSDDEVTEALQGAFGYYPKGTPTAAPTSAPVVYSTLSPAQLALVTVTPTVAEPSPFPTATPDAAAAPTVEASPYPTATPYTEEGYKSNLKTIVDELATIQFTEADLRDRFHNYLLMQKLSDKMGADVPTTQEQVWARHILVNEEAQAKDVLKRLEQGEDWSAIAAEVSQDTGNKDKGGDLGWFGKGAMVAEFEQSAFSLKVGEISQPVKTSFGYHIIQVLGHEERPLSAAELNTAKQNKFDAWLTTASAAEDIQRFDDSWADFIPTDPDLTTQF